MYFIEGIILLLAFCLIIHSIGAIDSVVGKWIWKPAICSYKLRVGDGIFNRRGIRWGYWIYYI